MESYLTSVLKFKNTATRENLWTVGRSEDVRKKVMLEV